ncbi:hypothetical protein BX600DRAFT_384601 [Xylariales sp. PMI_506]|nr:hypothetical protein BX600DRAFT_384601 [Xylariales sp. PMI_506]
MPEESEEKRRERILMDRRRMQTRSQPKIPRVRKVNFENFKNHYYGDDQDYTIEVLVAGSDLRSQIRKEEATRRVEEFAAYRRMQSLAEYRLKVSQPDSGAKGEAERSEKAPQGVTIIEGSHMERIRVQSTAVLGHLTQLLGITEKRSRPRTFFRPFKALVYLQPRMKKILAELEEKNGALSPKEEQVDLPSLSVTDGEPPTDEDGVQDTEDAPDETGSEASLKSITSDDGNIDDMMDSITGQQEMRCYVDFVDQEIMPMYHKFDRISSKDSENRVMFDDLWYLFRVGDLVFMPSTGDPTGRYHELWKIYRIFTPEPVYSYPQYDLSWMLGDEIPVDDNRVVTLYLYYIDHDGTSFGAVRHKIDIKWFPGEREIRSLDAFPVRYVDDQEELLSSLRKQGRNFQRLLTDRHQSYNGWTLTRNPPADTESPEDEILEDPTGNKMRHSEFVESHVIVDMAEAFQASPSWRPNFHQPSISKGGTPAGKEDPLPIRQWADRHRGKLLYHSPEILQLQDPIAMWERRDNILADEFLRKRVREYRRDRAKDADTSLNEEDLVLLPKRLFAYALRDRRFVLVDLKFLKPIVREREVFENLKILREYKDIVRGLVTAHFSQKALERDFRNLSTEGISQDIIQGKGKGLVILLHGVPGVGKTATAEAVAMESGKPLFVITCGDLGLSPTEVETSLNNVFRLAHLWDCVLLLDEADVFLSQRSRLDMKRNALASVFLRVLEYYSGLLFLTTNRVGTVDEAFKSRIHLSLYYPPLTKQQTAEIFKLNIKKLREIEQQRHKLQNQPRLEIKEDEIMEFASQHFDVNSESGGRWNGRQIRNAFQIASSLAYYHYSRDKDSIPQDGAPLPETAVVDKKLFLSVQQATQSFDEYMRETKGWSDADLAHLLGERSDYVKNVRRQSSTSVNVPRNAEGSFRISTPQFNNHSHASAYSRDNSDYGQGGRFGQDPRDRPSTYSQPPMSYPNVTYGAPVAGYGKPFSSPGDSSTSNMNSYQHLQHNQNQSAFGGQDQRPAPGTGYSNQGNSGQFNFPSSHNDDVYT